MTPNEDRFFLEPVDGQWRKDVSIQGFCPVSGRSALSQGFRPLAVGVSVKAGQDNVDCHDPLIGRGRGAGENSCA